MPATSLREFAGTSQTSLLARWPRLLPDARADPGPRHHSHGYFGRMTMGHPRASSARTNSPAPDADSRRTSDTVSPAQLKSADKRLPLRTGVFQSTANRGQSAHHVDHNDLRRVHEISVGRPMPDHASSRTVRPDTAAETRGCRLDESNKRWRGGLWSSAAVRQGGHGAGAGGARGIGMMVLFELGPPIIRNARMRRHVVQELIRVPKWGNCPAPALAGPECVISGCTRAQWRCGCARHD